MCFGLIHSLVVLCISSPLPLSWFPNSHLSMHHQSSPSSSVLQSRQFSSLPCLLRQPASQIKRWDSDTRYTAIDGSAAGGGREEKPGLLFGLDPNANEEGPTWGMLKCEWRRRNGQYLWCCADKLGQSTSDPSLMMSF